jgi:hypothetical protein
MNVALFTLPSRIRPGKYQNSPDDPAGQEAMNGEKNGHLLILERLTEQGAHAAVPAGRRAHRRADRFQFVGPPPDRRSDEMLSADVK